MKATHCFCLFVVLLLFTACSYLNLSESISDSQPLNLESTILETKGESELFYYYFDEKIYLVERQDLVFIRFVDKKARDGFLSELREVSSLRVWDSAQSLLQAKDDSFNILVLEATNGMIPREQVIEIGAQNGVITASYCMDYSGSILAVNNEFSVKLKQSSDYGKLEELISSFGYVLYHRDWFDSDEYFVQVPKDSEFDVIQSSILFYETGFFEYTSPDFFAFNTKCSNDTNFNLQWGLKNTGQYGTSGIDINIESAWSITEGDGDIIVAVLDDGVELSHPDLSGNIVTGYDPISNLGGAPVLNEDNHGTLVAGVIGAIKDNGIGISGVAPGCKIMPVRVWYSDFFSYSAAVAGFNWASSNGADVINCSWGVGSPCPSLTSAINTVIGSGRSGKGCVVVFSSGNTESSDYGSVSYPASLSGVMAVGAIDLDGKRMVCSSAGSNYNSSNYGTELDVVAPGVFIPTTDRSGTLGLDSSAYYNYFNCTSSAAPHVAGVAALILSEYPDLTQSQVRRAIELGCSSLNGYSYYSDSGYPSGMRNGEVGYGLVDAYQALLRAGAAHQQNVLDATSGIDFTITNGSSYDLEDVSIVLTGSIGGSPVTLISSIVGDVNSGTTVGYPVFRGETLYASPGATISNISVQLYARDPDSGSNLRVASEIDQSVFYVYDDFCFGSIGSTYQSYLSNSSVPNSCRRMLYIEIQDAL